MVVHYLYHLDYYTNSNVGHDYSNGYATGTHESIETPLQIREHNGHTDKSAHHEGTSDEALMEESSSAQGPDESGSVNVTSKNKKKNKKKQKRLSSGLIPTVTTQLNGSPVKEADFSNGTQCTEEYVVPVDSPSPSSLVVHAKVYALSKKYGINGLKLLALEKFRIEAEQEWDTSDILLAAKEVYTSTSAADQDIRDAVTTIVYEHPEILDRDETQELIKGLDLGFDVLKRVRAKGGFL
jgi:hypothetical protein